jgi:hypothetical protein
MMIALPREILVNFGKRHAETTTVNILHCRMPFLKNFSCIAALTIFICSATDFHLYAREIIRAPYIWTNPLKRCDRILRRVERFI